MFHIIFIIVAIFFVLEILIACNRKYSKAARIAGVLSAVLLPVYVLVYLGMIFSVLALPGSKDLASNIAMGILGIFPISILAAAVLLLIFQHRQKGNTAIWILFIPMLLSIVHFSLVSVVYSEDYAYENGCWNYITFDAGAGRRVRPMEGEVDAESFKEMKYAEFARDKNHVYYRARQIPGADPETFERIGKENHWMYMRDKSHVYLCVGGIAYPLVGADAESFQILEQPYSKDKNDAYCGNLKLFVDDSKAFEVTEGSLAREDRIPNGLFDPGWSEEDAKYNTEKYGELYQDQYVIFSSDGRAKTNYLEYEGYRLKKDSR